MNNVMLCGRISLMLLMTAAAALGACRGSDGTSSAPPAPDSALVARIREAIAITSSPNFLRTETSFASGPRMIEGIYAKSSEVKFLAANANASCPIIAERFREGAGTAARELIALAIAARMAGCVDAVPVLAGYITSFTVATERDSVALLGFNHPFGYTARTLHALCTGAFPAEWLDDPVERRTDIADRVLDWYRARR